MVQARLCWLLAAVLFPFITFAQVLAADKTKIVVSMDQAMVFGFPPAADVVLLGDPLIADIQWLRFSEGKLLAHIIAKGYGDTNVIAFDKDGHVLTEAIIQVTFPTDKDLVVVYSGSTDRQTLSCTPN